MYLAKAVFEDGICIVDEIFILHDCVACFDVVLIDE